MGHLFGLLFRLILALSLAALPWTQSWAMAVAQAPSMSCHMAGHAGHASDSADKSSPDSHSGECCGTIHCHCISAIALPDAVAVGNHRIDAHWEAWTPDHPHDLVFAPTPPPPRA